MIEALRTPDENFEGLPDYDFEPHYLDDLQDYEGLRMHYIDEPGSGEGSQVGETFLCLHGQPSWSFLYRKMIPVFAEAGGRVVAPDFFGFGRSDKPVEDEVYTFGFHQRALTAFIERLDLRNITLVCQDWGGLLGLTLVPQMPERFSRLIVMNTGIGIGQAPSEGFLAWREFNRTQRDLDIAALFQRSDPSLSDDVVQAYAAPYPNADYKAGVRRFPDLVATDPEMEGAAEGRRAIEFWSREWDGRSFMAIGMKDPVLGEGPMKKLASVIRGCPEPMEVAQGGHFVQEHGEEIARAAIAHFEAGG